MSNDTNEPAEEWWHDNVIRDVTPGQETWVSMPSNDDTPPTEAIHTIHATSDDLPYELDDNGQIEEGEDASETNHSHWKYFVTLLIQALLFSAVFALNIVTWSWMPWWIHLVIQVALTLACIVFIRRADRRWEATTYIPPGINELYRRMPHISMFFNSIILQIIIGLAALGISIGWYTLHHQTIWWNILVQAIVLTVNTYVIYRSYIKWSGTLYIVTQDFVVIKQSDSVVFLIFREKEVAFRKSTLVSQKRKVRTLPEYLFFTTRGTVRLMTQSKDGADIPVRYVSDIEGFTTCLRK